MGWLHIIARVDQAHAEAAAEALELAGAAAVTLRDAADQPLYEPAPGTTPLWASTEAVGLFPDDTAPEPVLAALVARLGFLPIWQVEPLEDQDWSRAWLKHFRPLRFGRRLWIVPSGFEAPDPQGLNLLLDPGLAFGTGSHPTTALCLEWLDAHPPRDATVIDYGCGSGILALAALRLGAQRVVAVDNDPQALEATRANARKNALEDSLEAVAPEDLPPVQAEAVVANILAGPLIALAPRLTALTAPGGSLVLSGILADQARDVLAAYVAAGCDPVSETTREGWVRLCLARP
ncbi:50S ribosomal protein L11 methyltransferase [Ectothiorhodospiraceae bacterium 2226]|nr:50S ribosomal protein L11 methyltransferase [Ectothiorhodospiraceae bacterium 2226]